MEVVNLYWLDHVWGPLGEGNPTEGIFMVDMDQPKHLDILSTHYIAPYISALPPVPRRRIKETWRYALNVYSDHQLKEAFESQLPPFSLPQDVRGFYLRVWQRVFEGETWRIGNLQVYRDIHQQFITPWDDIHS